MARWRCDEPHYIRACPIDLLDEGVTWEYKETDRVTGRERRKRFPVPYYCERGSVVCRPGSEKDVSDLIYEGPPTHAMTPLDKEAEQITDELRPTWRNAMIDAGQEFSNASMLESLAKQLAQAMNANGPLPQASPQTAAGVGRDEFAELQKQVAALMARNAELEAKAAGRDVKVEVDVPSEDAPPPPASRPAAHRRSMTHG